MKQPDTKRHKRPRWLIAVAVLLLAALAAWHGWRRSVERTIAREEAALRAEGYPLTPEELDAWYRLPEGEENAADYYQEAFSYLPTYPQLPPPIREAVDKVSQTIASEHDAQFSEDAKRSLLGYVETSQAAFPRLMEAVKRPHARFAGDAVNDPDVSGEYMEHLWGAENLLMSASFLHAEEGDAAKAFEGTALLLKVGESVEGEPFFNSQFSRNGCHKTVLNMVRRILFKAPVTDEQIKTIIDALTEAEANETFHRGLLALLVHSAHILTAPDSHLEYMEGVPLGRMEEALVNFDPSGSVPRVDYARVLQCAHAALDADRLPVEKRYAALGTARALAEHIPRYLAVSAFAAPAFFDESERNILHIAYMRSGIAALVVERYRLAHGELPASLEAAVPEYMPAVPLDPYTSQPLRYRLLSKGYVVYSVGPNLRDDEGVPTEDLFKTLDRTEKSDVAFRMER